MKSVLCLLTMNAAAQAPRLLEALQGANLAEADLSVIDSGSDDGTAALFLAAGFRVRVADRNTFDHGGTRQLAVEMHPEAEVIIFMTQDAIPADPRSLTRLISCFNDEMVGAAFGRQLPRSEARPIEAHARLFNYPAESRVKSAADIPVMGVKTAFISNSFAAYRRSALEAIGGFPQRCIVSEDTHVAARMLLAGWKIVYCAEAQVYHSHDYSWRQEFQRYFDIGVFHARESWVRKSFGGAEGEGGRFVRSELNYLASRAPHLIPSALDRTMIKYLGFRAGLAERFLPLALKRRLSMQKAFWNAETGGPECSDNKPDSSTV